MVTEASLRERRHTVLQEMLISAWQRRSSRLRRVGKIAADDDRHRKSDALHMRTDMHTKSVDRTNLDDR